MNKFLLFLMLFYVWLMVNKTEIERHFLDIKVQKIIGVE